MWFNLVLMTAEVLHRVLVST